MSERSEIWIRDAKTQLAVSAVLIDGLSRDEVRDANAAWKAVVDPQVQAVREGRRDAADFPRHSHWDWDKKFDLIDGLLAYECLGVEVDGVMQGMMIVQSAGVYSRLPETIGQGLVYVKYLASAPWNLHAFSAAPKYREVGAVLLSAAVQASLEIGFRGRVGLHSLNQSKSWYEKNEMTCLGIDDKEENLHYFEFTEVSARKFIS